MAILRMFASAREVAGTASAVIDGQTVAEVLDKAIVLFGQRFAEVLLTSKVWVNGEEVSREHAVGNNDEVAVLPPVSGGI